MRFLSIAASLGLIASVTARTLDTSDAKLQARTYCDVGKAWVNGRCQDCSAGQFSQGGYNPQCKSCPAGSTSGSCESYCVCQPGFYINGGKTTNNACNACSAGYSSSQGASGCSPCPANTFSTAGGTCQACPSGYTSNAASGSCQPKCQAGTYLSSGSCRPCSAGSYSSAGATSCTSCPSGTFATSSNGQTCTSCPRNTYSNGDSCSPCPAGSTSNPGSSSCGPQPSRRAEPASAPQCSGAGMQRCDVLSGFGGSECINILTTLDSCGGCVGPEGEDDTPGKYTGRDCTAIPHVDEVKCVQGGCEIKSCRAGYEPSGGFCVEKAAYVGKNQTSHGARAKRGFQSSHHDTF